MQLGLARQFQTKRIVKPQGIIEKEEEEDEEEEEEPNPIKTTLLSDDNDGRSFDDENEDLTMALLCKVKLINQMLRGRC